MCSVVGDSNCVPEVSVITAVYNGHDVIGDALESLKKQTFTDWECIICDDGSIDATWEVINEVVHGDTRFRLLRNEVNRGPAYSRNRCISTAQGEYIAIQDADDISFPNRLDEQVRYLDAFHDVSAVGTHAGLFNDTKQYWGVSKVPEYPKKKDWVKGPQVIHASTMLRKKDFQSVGQYNEKLLKAEDYDLWVRFIASGHRITSIPKVLYGIHWDSSDYTRKKMKHRWNEIRVRHEAIKTFPLPPYFYIYLLKPLFLGVLPPRLVYFCHFLRFRNHMSNKTF